MCTIADNNKLIAEFLGYVQPHPDYPNSTYWYKKDESPLTILSFNYDWNWIMNAVDKINELGYHVSIHDGHALISDECNPPIVDEFDRKTITATYKAVIEFINFYNRQQHEN